VRWVPMARPVGLCVALALALSLAAAPGASAGRRAHRVRGSAPPPGSVMVLKANGQTLPNGALVAVKLGVKPEFLLKALVTIEGTTTAKEFELECENYLEQGQVERNSATDVWRIVDHPVEICEGEPWLEEALVSNTLTFTPPKTATEELSAELFRPAEAIRAEERKQAEAGVEVDPREPLRCAYATTLSKGTFSHNTKKPFTAKIKGKLTMLPVANDAGCGLKKAKWKASFTIEYKGAPVFLGYETPPPSVNGVSPAEGPEAEGTSVEIKGNGFVGATAVTFGTTSAASFKVNSANSITAIAPKGSGGVDVTVTTPEGTSATTPADTFTYRPVPSVTEMTPKTGAETGGTEVTITGTNFTSGSSVSFGTTPASTVKVNSAESITAVSPPGTGTVKVTVTTAGGTSASIPADEFTY
jgi:IPT/TIG domain